VDDDVAETDRRSWARDTIAQLDVLPREQVQALRLVYRDGLMLSEAAARLNVTLGEFARHVAAGLQTLGGADRTVTG
jgi:DNA-directed RNA polymerase specialized sigma24 family protein